MQTKTTMPNRALLGGLVLVFSALLTVHAGSQISAQTAAPTTAPTSAATATATTVATTAATKMAATAVATAAATMVTAAPTTLATPTLQTIQSARAAKDGVPVLVQGTVTVGTRLFDDTGRSLYIQDATGGVNIYFSKGNLPTFAEGDMLQISGKMLTFANHREIAPTSLDAVKKLNTDAGKLLIPTAFTVPMG